MALSALAAASITMALDRAASAVQVQTRIIREVMTPKDLETEYGVTEGSLYHGEMGLDQVLFMRPVAGWARHATPVPGLYLCGAGTHPGGGITGTSGRLAAAAVLK